MVLIGVLAVTVAVAGRFRCMHIRPSIKEVMVDRKRVVLVSHRRSAPRKVSSRPERGFKNGGPRRWGRAYGRMGGKAVHSS